MVVDVEEAPAVVGVRAVAVFAAEEAGATVVTTALLLLLLLLL